MQHVSTYNSHLQAKLRTVNALQGGCTHLGSHMTYSIFAVVFSVHKVSLYTMLLYVGLSTWPVQNYYLWTVVIPLCSSPLEWGGWWCVLSLA